MSFLRLPLFGAFVLRQAKRGQPAQVVRLSSLFFFLGGGGLKTVPGIPLRSLRPWLCGGERHFEEGGRAVAAAIDLRPREAGKTGKTVLPENIVTSSCQGVLGPIFSCACLPTLALEKHQASLAVVTHSHPCRRHRPNCTATVPC